MLTATKLQLRTVWLSRSTKAENIADALRFLASVKISSKPKLDQGRIQYLDLDLDLDSRTGWAWKDIETCDRFSFVQQCQRLGMDMATDEALAALDSYFGEEG